MNEAYIFDAVRTPRGKGKREGALYQVKPIHLLAATFNAIKERNQLNTKEVDDAVIGCVTPINDQGANIAKAGLLYAGWDDGVGGMQINRFCASGLEAVNLAAMKVRSGWEDLVVAGGIESMSRVPLESDGGPLMFDPEVQNKVGYIPQGVAADLIATMEGFDRERVDRYALQSYQRASFAYENAYFEKSIIPIHDKNGLVLLDKDEELRPDTNLEKLSKLAPAFAEVGSWGYDTMALNKYPVVERIEHVHTAGNSSGVVDGASLVLVGNKEKGKALGLTPRARILSIGALSTEPTIMLQGPTPAALKALKRAGMTSKDIELWEMNEAFAAAVLKFQQDMDISDDILNVNGGAIAMGHPMGATGAMLIGTLLDEMERRDLSVGLVTMCVASGMGVATILERI